MGMKKEGYPERSSRGVLRELADLIKRAFFHQPFECDILPQF